MVRAPRGSRLSAKSWLTEAPLRMIMNNLDPEVAERPDGAERVLTLRKRGRDAAQLIFLRWRPAGPDSRTSRRLP